MIPGGKTAATLQYYLHIDTAETGTTAYDKLNVQVFNTHITVTGNDGGGTVTLNRGAQRVTLNCAGGRCEPTPMPGEGALRRDGRD